MSSTDENDTSYFDEFVNYASCTVVTSLPYSERCGFVKEAVKCKEMQGYINYVEVLYCTFKPENDLMQIIASMPFFSLCFIIFIILCITADKFFCPALKYVAKTVGMNEHLAGVTLLAFGNGSPDLLTSLNSVDGAPRLLFSDLFGAAMFVVAFIGGIIILMFPFIVEPINIIRDVCFFAFGALYIEYAIMSDESVNVVEAISILMIYVAYLVVTILDQYLLKRSVKAIERRITKTRAFATEAHRQKLEKLRNEADIEVYGRYSRVSRTASRINVQSTRISGYRMVDSPNSNLFPQFLESLNPIDDEWPQLSTGWRVMAILKMPFTFILQILIPVCDFELDGHGWSKLLNCLQVTILPSFLCFAIFTKSTWLGIPLFIYPMIIAIPFSIIIFLTSRTDLPPNYHIVFACYAIFGSMYAVYACASETVEILSIMGMVTFRSNAFLGCTVLAWGNGVGDLVSNLSLARSGYQKMGFSACLGGPMFNSFLAMGATYLYRALTSEDKQIEVDNGPLGENIFVFLICTLLYTLLWSASTNFVARRSTGIFMIAAYIMFFSFTLLSESEIIQAYAPEKTRELDLT